MNRFLFFVVLLLVAVAACGFYLGWFHFSTDQSDQKTNITITVDKNKIEEDKEKGKEKIKEVSNAAKERVSKPAEKGRDRQ